MFARSNRAAQSPLKWIAFTMTRRDKGESAPGGSASLIFSFVARPTHALTFRRTDAAPGAKVDELDGRSVCLRGRVRECLPEPVILLRPEPVGHREVDPLRPVVARDRPADLRHGRVKPVAVRPHPQDLRHLRPGVAGGPRMDDRQGG